jgi:antitoxin (DNA-binding transcriptional repressor) of toxin-antitoxin stability system
VPCCQSMHAVTLEEAQARLPELIAETEGGGEIVITRGDKPVAKLTAALAGAAKSGLSLLGLLKGKVVFVRHEVNPMIVRYEKYVRRTCGSVRSSLSAPARLVTVGSEAAETRLPSLRGKRLPRGRLKLRASTRFWESAG